MADRIGLRAHSRPYQLPDRPEDGVIEGLERSLEDGMLDWVLQNPRAPWPTDAEN